MSRILLYIDDLDRCPDSKVIEVLQAVHLLLAFSLFVVVVAVDSRWLAHALQTRYPALSVLSGAKDQNAARPDDYLEKIFQIPFWVQPLGDSGRQRIVRGLLRGHLRVEAAASSAGGPERPELGEEAAKVIQELESLDNLAPLMGDTPRSVKRFVNVYQIVKILCRGQVSVAGTPLSDLQVAAFLLAIAEGLPELAWRLFDQVRIEPGVTALATLVDNPVFAACELERKRLKAWLLLNTHHGWNALDAGRLAERTTDVERFLFRVASRGGAAIAGLRPQLVHVIQER